MSLLAALALFGFYTVVIGGIVAVLYWYTTKHKTPKPTQGPAVPNIAGLHVKPIAEVTPVLWTKTATPSDTMLKRAKPVEESAAVHSPAQTLPTLNEIVARTHQRDGRSNNALEPHALKALAGQTASLASLTTEQGLLPEGLRTLVASNAVVEPGSIVHAAFTFRNLGGGAATGFFACFRKPPELTYCPGSAKIDNVLLDDSNGETALLQQCGAPLGVISAGAQRRITLSYLVAPVIENNSAILLQAALASTDVPVIGTNIVRLTVSSQPTLKNTLTEICLNFVAAELPGNELDVAVRIHNAGPSSAHDVAVLLPLPPHTSFVPGSATINDRLAPPENLFGTGRPTIVAPSLAPSETVTASYRVKIDATLENATRITATGVIGSQETTAFSVDSDPIEIISAASFAGPETTVRLECTNDVKPGDQIRLLACAKNTGTSIARQFQFHITLPDGLAYTAGSLAIDNVSTFAQELRKQPIELADLAPNEAVEISLWLSVRSPLSDGHELAAAGNFVWLGGNREFTRTLTARSAARFPLNCNKLVRESPLRTEPGDAVACTVFLQNKGTDTATQVKLEINADPRIEHLRVREHDTDLDLNAGGGSVKLGSIKPGMTRTFSIDGYLAQTIEDQTEIKVNAALVTLQTPRIDLGTISHTIHSAPKFSVETCRLSIATGAPLQSDSPIAAQLTIINTGNDAARGATVTLLLPPELGLNDGAPTDNTIVLGDIAVNEPRVFEINLTLMQKSAPNRLRIGARLGATNAMPLHLSPLDIDNDAQPSFETHLKSEPSAEVNDGEPILYTLTMRNVGNGAARRLVARLTMLTDAVYAYATTTVNSIALQDNAGTSLLFGRDGLQMTDIAPGIEVAISWSVIVNTPLTDGTTIEAVVAVSWGPATELAVRAEPLRVRSASAIPLAEPSLPFSVVDAVAAPRRKESLPALTSPTQPYALAITSGANVGTDQKPR